MSTPEPVPPAPDAKLEPIPVQKREIVAWAGFDFANGSFTMIITTLVYQLYFIDLVAGKDDNGQFLWGLTIFISQFLIVVLSPFIGALADIGGNKKTYLFIVYSVCTVFTALLAVVGEGDLAQGMIFFILANAGYALGENLASAFLPELSTPKTMGRISAFGWGMGYLGSLVSLAMVLPLLMKGFGADNMDGMAWSMVITAAFFAIGGAPMFFMVRERARPQPWVGGHNVFYVSWARVFQTLRLVAHNRSLALFFGALFAFMCGLAAVTSFFTVFSKTELDFGTEGLMGLLLVIQVSAAVGAFAFGFLEDRIGHRLAMQISLVMWVLAVVMAYFVTEKVMFFVVANFAGLALGGCQSASRVFIGLLSPPERRAEYFGLWGLVGKAATGVGPLTYGLITVATAGNPRPAILAVAGFFIVAIILVQLMPHLEPVHEERVV